MEIVFQSKGRAFFMYMPDMLEEQQESQQHAWSIVREGRTVDKEKRSKRNYWDIFLE